MARARTPDHPIKNRTHDVMKRAANFPRRVALSRHRRAARSAPAAPAPGWAAAAAGAAGLCRALRLEAATGHPLQRPTWTAARDPLANQPARQQLRGAAVRAMWGDEGLGWTDILHNQGRAKFIPSYIIYLSFQ